MFGAFWGTFDAADNVRVLDLTLHGALIETSHPIAVESVQTVCLMLDGQPALADARVRHVRSTAGSDQFLVGLEFTSVSTMFADAVERVMAFHPDNTELA